jgi:LemA protein
MTALLVLIGLVVAVGIFLVGLYNGLVRLRNGVKNAWAQIEVQLKRRHDLIPNLVETVKGYASHERETLESVIKARQQAIDITDSVVDKVQAENMLSRTLRSLFAVAEQYPDLKADQTFQHLQARITGLENDIADRREFYNESVNLNNIRIEQFPDVIIARMFAFKAFELLEFSEEEKTDVDMKELFT